MINIEKLSKNYKKNEALKDISLTVKKGELFAYLGPNGAGKTTTIRILTGLTHKTGGTAYLNGFDISKETLKAKRQYGVVPQSTNLDHELSVYENLYIHGLLYHMQGAKIKERIDMLLSYVALKDRKKSPVKELSGGMKRRVLIARALLHEPVILFLDEPTVGLDATIRRRIWGLIKKIQQDGTTVFLTTHYIEEAEFLADRVAFIDKGTIVAVGTPHHLMEKQGAWAIDLIENGQVETQYFNTREDADQYNVNRHKSYTLRRVNLEDVFLTLTGKKVTE
ncbi:MAG: ABC transporter ATP-binding protein [Proteobacteria bacterium]|nr:ABC transporter ATP-binding protein [Pseudomonadota bacterium]